jgi:putrescine transport system substrate-binding protein
MWKLFHRFVFFILPSLSVIIFCSSAIAEERDNILNIYNWSVYIAPDTIKNFEKETGVKVHYDTYDNNDTLQAKLIAGHSGYDLVVPRSNYAQIDIQAGLLQKIDRSKIPNWRNQDTSLLDKMTGADPSNQYLVDWRWGYLTIGINKEAVTKAMGVLPMPENPWSLVFDPKYAKLISTCGISITDTAQDVIPSILVYLNRKPNSTNPIDYKAISKLLLSIRPYIRKISTIGWIDDLDSDNICLAIAPSGDINIAKENAIKNNAAFNIETIVPKTGAFLFFDTMAIPKDAEHVENALQFINYVLDPKVSASITNAILYPGPVPSSMTYTKKSIAKNTSVFLTPTALVHMHPPVLLNKKIRTLQINAWDSLKTGL